MTNLEIARAFGEEDMFKDNILKTLYETGHCSVGYCIFAEDHEPFTEEQQKIWDEYGDGELLELVVDVDLETLFG